jgi:molybdate transport system ATP-binding protein
VLFDSERGIDVPVERRRIGYVFQTLALFPHLTVLENVEYGLRAADRRTRSVAILEQFRIGHLCNRRPGQVSGGERQRVALARALVTDPCVLLLDEPLSALDLPTRARLMEDLRAWNDAHQIPILYVTHAREEAFSLGERVLVLENGRLLAQGSPREVLDAPRHELTAQLAGVQNIFDATVLALHEDEGTMTCRIEGGSTSAGLQLEVPLARIEQGARLRVGIRAGDILLASVRPQGLSARNLLAGRVLSITRQDITVIVRVDCGVTWEVYLTPAAQHELDLHPDSAVWLIIKTYSCHLLR